MTEPVPFAISPAGVHQRAVSLLNQASALLITDQRTLDLATEYLSIEAELRHKIEAHHAPVKAAAWAAHHAACDAEKRALTENCGPIRQVLTPKITAYQQEQRRLAIAEQARLQAEENRRAEEARLAEAMLLQEQGVSEQDVDAVLAAPIIAPYVPPPATMRLGGGVSERWEYSAQVLNLMILLKAVVEGVVPLSAIEVSQKYLNGRARSDKETFSIPGCRLVKSTDLTVRRQR